LHHTTPPRSGTAARRPAGPVFVALAAMAALGGCSNGEPAAGMSRVPAVVAHLVDGTRAPLGAASDTTHVVNFWATSCAVCVEEMPDLAAFASAHPNLRVVAVAMPYDPPDRVVTYAEREAPPFAVALDVEGKVLEAFPAFDGTPTTFVVDADGAVLSAQSGRIDFERLARTVDRPTATPAGKRPPGGS